MSSEDIGHLCQSVLQDFSNVLSLDPTSVSTNMASMVNGCNQEQNGEHDSDFADDSDGEISSSLMVKLVAVTITAVTRLQSIGKNGYVPHCHLGECCKTNSTMKVLFSSFPKNDHTAWFDPQTKKLEPLCITKQTVPYESTVQ